MTHKKLMSLAGGAAFLAAYVALCGQYVFRTSFVHEGERIFVLWDRLEEVFARMTPEGLMEKRPNLHPESWADWPVFMRFLRPLIDYATHIGQVNYARRQLGKPVKRV